MQWKSKDEGREREGKRREEKRRLKDWQQRNKIPVYLPTYLPTYLRPIYVALDDDEDEDEDEALMGQSLEERKGVRVD